MGELLFITPLLIYYIVIVPVVKIKIINDIERKKLRAFVFAVLLLLPIGDHLIGYVVYKVLCYTKGGVHIYKTVTDRKEQRDYWIYNHLVSGILDSSQYTEGDERFDKDRENRKITVPLSNKVTFRRGEFASGYLNYCTPAYDTLPKTNPNYKYSCRHTQEIIKKYHLKNVIRVPKSKYGMYISNFDKNYDSNLPIFYIKVNKGKIYNIKTGEVLAEYREYGFGGGWYVQLFSPFPFGVGCGDTRISKFQELVIPNPYKKDKR